MRAIPRSWGDVREVQGGWAGTSSEPSPPMTWPVMGHRLSQPRPWEPGLLDPPAWVMPLERVSVSLLGPRSTFPESKPCGSKKPMHGGKGADEVRGPVTADSPAFCLVHGL